MEEQQQAGTTEDLQKKIKECEIKRDEYLAGWQRERADFQNYKKDEARRVGELREYSQAQLIAEVLPVLDSFDLALNFMHAQTEGHKRSGAESRGASDDIDKLTEGWIHGTEQMHIQLLDILKREGVEIIRTEGEMFNPALHESVEEVKSDKPEGTIVEEIQRGYTLNGRTIRPARVKVARRESSSQPLTA